ncbi:Ff.00g063390.m01.CDS01 [Fusarium sp. VM40]|nr:Ff.00g063390.m01.CDS01 [Fusarium sp. VM40]
MAEYQRPSSREDFEIAVICALRREYDAVCLLFDDDGDTYGRVNNDYNNYETGRIGRFHVVVVLLGDIGPVSSGSATTALRISYPNIKMALVVGVCGAVPKLGDDNIRCGDIIISKSVFQHDYGRQNPDRFEIKDSTEGGLGPATKDIRNLLVIIQTDRGLERLKSRTTAALEQLQQKATSERWEIPQAKDDGQMEAASSFTPAIFFGPIASGSAVIKSEEHRDKLAKENGAVAFEMEGAGVWPELPCLVVKGVCDYADVNKQKKWQDFAAATAAATAKAILQQYIQSDKPARAGVSVHTTATQEGSTYTETVKGNKVEQGNEMGVRSNQPPRNYLQKGSEFGSHVEANGDVRQGNKMSFF